MKTEELRREASRLGIKNYSRIRKVELEKLVNEALEAEQNVENVEEVVEATETVGRRGHALGFENREFASKSEAIRILHFDDGMSINEIHKQLGVRYQMVHNVIKRALEDRSEEHTSELQSRGHIVCRLLLE